jgi:hypothetical protein
VGGTATGSCRVPAALGGAECGDDSGVLVSFCLADLNMAGGAGEAAAGRWEDGSVGQWAGGKQQVPQQWAGKCAAIAGWAICQGPICQRWGPMACRRLEACPCMAHYRTQLLCSSCTHLARGQLASGRELRGGVGAGLDSGKLPARTAVGGGCVRGAPCAEGRGRGRAQGTITLG